MKDYTLFIRGDKCRESKGKEDFLHFASITKFIVLFGFLSCIEAHKLKLNTKIKKIFPEYPYTYTFLDIINHKTILDNSWMFSDLQKSYHKSKNIYEFALHIKKNSKLSKSKFNYSNYTYDILSYVVYKLERVYIDKYLEKTILKNVKYKWVKRSGKPISSYGFFVHTSTFKIFAKNLWDILQTRDLSFFWNTKWFIPIGTKKYYLIGHDGSGGQYMYYSLKLNSILFWFSYDDKDEQKRTPERYIEKFKKYISLIPP